MTVTEFDATVRKVGDSMGVLIPRRVVEELKARPGKKLHGVIPAKVDGSTVWGKFQTKKSTSDLIRKSRTERD